MNVDENIGNCTNWVTSVEEASQISDEESNIAIDSHESEELFTSTKNLNIALTWTDLSYVVSEFNWLPTFQRCKPSFQSRKRIILHPQSGQLSSANLMALTGKSGCGKSTLIESITGRKTQGLRGSVSFRFDSAVSSFVREKDIKIAFIPQTDMLYGTLTIGESILFATKLKNRRFSSKEHQTIIEQLLNEFDLNVCKDNRLSKCSGGEKKRLSVAMELVSKPNVLVLDEPTSGLDSSSALQCIKLLRKLTQSTSNPLAIMVSIHQPSAKLLEEFHSLYLLSYDGRCLYNGPVKNLLSVFEKFNVPCAQYHNPADHALEVSSGDYGQAVVDTMAEYVSNTQKQVPETGNTARQVASIIKKMRNHSEASLFSHCSTLTARNLKTTFRDPILNYSRLLQQVLVGAAIIVIYGDEVGKVSGCTNHFGNVTLNAFLSKQHQERNALLFQNIGLVVVSLIMILFGAIMPIVLVFPTEMAVFARERSNGWYSCLSFYLAKTFADTPFLLVYTTIFSLMVYCPTGQVNEIWRVASFVMISILVAFCGQSIGMIIGTIFVNNERAAAFSAPVTILPLTLFGGFFVRIRHVPTYVRIFCHLSCMRFAFEAMVTIFYGFNRCGYLPEDNLNGSDSQSTHEQTALSQNLSTSDVESIGIQLANLITSAFSSMDINQNGSLAMQEFGLKDYYLWTHTVILIVFVIVLKILAYILLLRKVNHRN